MIQEPENFESLLDQALQSYSSAEPRSGLNERILARAKSHTPMRSRPGRNIFWITAAAVSLAAILAILVSSKHSVPKQQAVARTTPAPAYTVSQQALVQLPKQVTRNARQPLHHVSHPSPVSEHGLPQFSDTDRLLIQFASLNPQEALILSQLQKASDRQITIPPLQIHPVASNPIVIAPIAMNRDEHENF
jgi:hypothetical protein